MLIILRLTKVPRLINLLGKRILTLIMNKIFLKAPKHNEENGPQLQFGITLLNLLYGLCEPLYLPRNVHYMVNFNTSKSGVDGPVLSRRSKEVLSLVTIVDVKLNSNLEREWLNEIE